MPLRSFIYHWLRYGEIEDPFDEYFIKQDKNLNIVDGWGRKFSLKTESLPAFLGEELCKKVMMM